MKQEPTVDITTAEGIEAHGARVGRYGFVDRALSDARAVFESATFAEGWSAVQAAVGAPGFAAALEQARHGPGAAGVASAPLGDLTTYVRPGVGGFAR